MFCTAKCKLRCEGKKAGDERLQQTATLIIHVDTCLLSGRVVLVVPVATEIRRGRRLVRLREWWRN